MNPSSIKYSFALPNLVATISSGKVSEDKSEAMPKGFTPGPHHVMCGRGKKVYEHNEAFRALVSTRLEEYSAASSKPEKSRIVTLVFDDVNQKGGFVRQDSKSKLWYSVPEMMAREKISQAFRDCLTKQYKSSKDCRQRKRKQAREELRKSEQQWDESSASASPAAKRCRPASPPTALKTSEALKQLLMFSQKISKSTVSETEEQQTATTAKRNSLIGMEIPVFDTSSVPSFHDMPSMRMHHRGSIRSISDLSFAFGDISDEFFPTPQISA